MVEVTRVQKVGAHLSSHLGQLVMLYDSDLIQTLEVLSVIWITMVKSVVKNGDLCPKDSGTLHQIVLNLGWGPVERELELVDWGTS